MNGVVYYLAGQRHRELLVVSLFSLRKVYSGPVTVLYEETLPEELKNALLVLEASPTQLPAKRDKPMVRKASIWRHSPYDITIQLDADTAVLKPIDELFDLARQNAFVVPQFSNWTTITGPMPTRIKPYVGLSPYASKCISKNIPAINTGVIGYVRGATILPEWERLTKMSASVCFIPDEVSCQVLLPGHAHKVIPSYWNESVKYPISTDPRIIHYHGKKNDAGLALCEIWKNLHEEAISSNLTSRRPVAIVRPISAPAKAKPVPPAPLLATSSALAGSTITESYFKERGKRIISEFSDDLSRMPSDAPISIIVPAWNAVQFLPSLVRDFSTQTGHIPEFEMLIGIDACEKTRTALLEMKLPTWIRLFWFAEHVGPYVIRNSLVHHAKHPYIVFFDADDQPFPSFLSMICSRRMGIGAVRYWYRNVDAVTGIPTKDKLQMGCGVFGIWRELLFRTGGFLPWRCQADYEWWHTAGQGITRTETDGIVFNRRRHKQQLTRMAETDGKSALRLQYKKSVGSTENEHARGKTTLCLEFIDGNWQEVATGEPLRGETNRPIYLIPLSDGIGNIIQSTPFVSHMRASGAVVYGVVYDDTPQGISDLMGNVFDGYIKESECQNMCRTHLGVVGPKRIQFTDEAAEWRLWFRLFGIEEPLEGECFTEYSPFALDFDVCLCPGSKPNWPMKMYPHWQALLQLLLDRGLSVAILGGPKDGQFNEIGSAVDLRGKLSLREVAGVLRNARICVANDCGLSHISAAQGTPTLILFGGSSVRKNLPPRHATPISAGLPCQPCQFNKPYQAKGKPTIWYGCRPEDGQLIPIPKCLTKLSPDVVMDRAMQLLGERP